MEVANRTSTNNFNPNRTDIPRHQTTDTSRKEIKRVVTKVGGKLGTVITTLSHCLQDVMGVVCLRSHLGHIQGTDEMMIQVTFIATIGIISIGYMRESLTRWAFRAASSEGHRHSQMLWKVKPRMV
jgi:hypothetical protein